jgi:co-chaperonin GroES (HSP10)
MKENKTSELIKGIKIDKHLSDVIVPIIPLKDKVILKKIDASYKTAAGLEIIELDKSNRPLGRIVAVGPNCSEDMRKGLTVVYDSAMWTPLLLNGIDYVMINEAFIDCVVADLEKVHVPVKPITGEDIRKANKISEVKRIRKMNAENFDNKMDEYHEKAKDRHKNPIISKYKKR